MKYRKRYIISWKKAKQKKQTAYFKVDKLIINGQIYRGEETTNLPYYGLIMDTRNSGNYKAKAVTARQHINS